MGKYMHHYFKKTNFTGFKLYCFQIYFNHKCSLPKHSRQFNVADHADLMIWFWNVWYIIFNLGDVWNVATKHIEAETRWPSLWQTTFSNTFSWMKIYEFRLKFHWSLFPRVHLFNNIPALFQKMAWCWSGNKPLSEMQWWHSLCINVLLRLNESKQLLNKHYRITKMHLHITTLHSWNLSLY